MTAPSTSRVETTRINHLQLGSTYRATTPAGAATGEYLGMETPHGDTSILLRHTNGTVSIVLDDVTSILLVAA
ncbi:MAG: hypothetical protein OES13_09510 [Acidimicrobiia bacterium]|nr:hypothetical protein [Acidimicrobiia bacterium]